IDENGNSFMVGRDILAACVFDEGESKAEVFLPKADDWYLKDKFFKGGRKITLDIPAEGEAVYLTRAGSVIPENAADYGFKMGESIVLNVYAKESGSFTGELFFDDGESIEYLNNNCTKLHFNVECNENEVVIHCENTGNNSLEYDIKLIDFKKRTKIIK
ncbi:MAG: DUF5110 domain-containing protein, partial [Eubacterium sp.]|nr:DUF5110 domain-containing protein [Eubacterium sp.]